MGSTKFVTFVTAVSIAVLLGAGDAPPAGPKSLMAVAAIKRADAAVDAAEKTYTAAVEKTRKMEAGELRAASKQAAAKSDADEIVAIAAKLKELEAESPASMQSDGVWTINPTTDISHWMIAGKTVSNREFAGSGELSGEGRSTIVSMDQRLRKPSHAAARRSSAR